MSKWLNIEDVHFPNRAAIVEIDRIDIVNHPKLLKGLIACRHGNDHPTAIEEVAREVVESLFPNLKDCTLRMIGYEAFAQSWAIIVEHPSLQLVAIGAECPRLRVPDESVPRKLAPPDIVTVREGDTRPRN